MGLTSGKEWIWNRPPSFGLFFIDADPSEDLRTWPSSQAGVWLQLRISHSGAGLPARR